MPGEIYELKCDMKKDCNSDVVMLDDRGFIYCATHGLQRRNSGSRCRKLSPTEIKKLKRGETLRY
jgi:hypothetical protein